MPWNNSLKFPVTPPSGVNKTWEVTLTPLDMKIKCNTLEVLHFIFNTTYDVDCTSKVKGKAVTRITFSRDTDTATKMFKSELFGKLCDMCIHYPIVHIMWYDVYKSNMIYQVI